MSEYGTIQECLNAADELNMSNLFMEGDSSYSDVINSQKDVNNPDDGEHDQDQGATGDRFNDFMDQIPQMNPSDPNANNYDGDSEPPTYDDSQFGNGYDSMPMPQQPMMQPQPMMMPMQPMMPQQPMMAPQPMMMPQPMVQPIPVAQPVQMPYYGQPMPAVQPFNQMQPGVMQAQMPNNTPYGGGVSQEVPQQEDPNAAPPPPEEDPNAVPPEADPNAQAAPADPNQDPNAAAPEEDPNMQDMGADPNQQAPQDQGGVPGQDQMNQEQPPEDNYDQQDPNIPQDDMGGMDPNNPEGGDMGEEGNPEDPNSPDQEQNPDDPLASGDPNDPNAGQEGPDENQRLSHNIDQLNKLETQVSNLSEKINNEKIDKLKKSINQLINGVTDNMANLRDKPELPKLNDMIEKFLNNCIDELNGVVDKEKSRQTQEEEKDNEFKQNDQIDPNDIPRQEDDNQTVQQPVQKGY